MRRKPTPSTPAPPPAPAIADRLAVALLLVWSVVMAIVVFALHRTPLYGVETDLIGDYIPAARDLLAGMVRPERYEFHGPGYPLLLALSSLAAGRDFYLGARLLNLASALVAGVFAWRLVRHWLGAGVAFATLAALLATPVFVRATLEAGTDMPALALALAATWMLAASSGAALAVLGGLVAAWATLTRESAVFLVPAALVIFHERDAGRRAGLAWLAAFALPIAAWLGIQIAVAGHLFANKNHLNLAYEIYSNGESWERFWLETTAPFRSLLEVVRFDPPRFVLHVGRNAVTRWMTDARQLMPPWIGWLAVPGLALTWWRRPGWRAFLAPFVFCYLVLCLVFYTPRFFLYLLPFYLSGAGALLVAPDAALGGVQPPAWVRRLGPWIAAILVVATGAAAVRETRALLYESPDETRMGGAILRPLARPGDGVMARKPHVAYFAGMDYVAMPYAEAFGEFVTEARATGARYLFVSPIEVNLRPQLSILLDPDARLPGLERIGWRGPEKDHPFAVFRFTRDAPADSLFEDSLLTAIRRFAARRPGLAWPQTYLGGQLVDMHRFGEALAPLAEAARLAPDDPLVARFQAVASFETGDLEGAARAAERASRLTGGESWEEGYLGHVRLAQGRYAEAREHLARAVREAPSAGRYAADYQRADSLWRATTARR